MKCDLKNYVQSEKYINQLRILIDEQQYDPHAMFNLLDEHENNISDRSIPNLDRAIRRKVHKKAIETAKIFRFFDVYQNTLEKDSIHLVFHNKWLPILKMIHDIYIYQLEPEILS